jgi:lipopolysaccharide transport system permease protein
MEIELFIRPNKALALVDFGELWRYRDLLMMFVWRDFAVKYKQTILGPIWFLLQPLLPALVFTLLSKVASISTDGVPRLIFFLCNQIIWGYFSNNFTSIGNALLGNMNLFSKVYFPRLLVPLSTMLSSLVTLGVQFGLFAGFYLYYKFFTPAGGLLHLSLVIFYLPFIILYLGAMSMGFGLWMAVLTAKYRDLQQLSVVIIQLWMYGSGVIFPLSQIPVKYQAIVSLNPVTFATESARYCLLGQGTLSWAAGLWSVGVTTVVFFSGLWNFNRTARTYVDIA